jgi:hypothetical protein
MISIPIAVYNDHFKWQLDLFWFQHKKVYGDLAASKAFAAIAKRNRSYEIKQENFNWNLDIPHAMVDSFFDYLNIPTSSNEDVSLPLNIQTNLAQIIENFNDELVIEVLDCDMFHMDRYPEYRIRDDELIVSDIYESWHLESLSKHRDIISMYFENGGRFYNGGFVPIIGKVRTFKKILPEWIAVHQDILARPYDSLIHWWGGMYGLQAACEKNKVRMIAENCCYIPGINSLSHEHYIGHYSVDRRFNKRTWPNINISNFENNVFYNRIQEWLSVYKP